MRFSPHPANEPAERRILTISRAKGGPTAPPRATPTCRPAGEVIVVPSARKPPMRTQSTDTPPEIEEILLEGYRRMPPVEKLRQVFDLNRTAQRMAALRIEARYGPNLAERELRLRLAALWLDRETMIKAFGWDPEVEGY